METTPKKYAMVVPTSMGIRLTPADSQPFHCSDTFKMYATSAESNVASVPAYLGMPVKVLTAFVKGSPVSHFIKDNLGSRRMEFEGPEFEQTNPWGYRHQINMADCGWASRGPRVQNDRAGEVGLDLSAEDFDLERIFAQEGAEIVHLSGLIAALSPKTSQFCLDVARVAKENGSLISFDLNYRASFWKGREEELSKTFAEIASRSDILIGNEEDFSIALALKARTLAAKGWRKRLTDLRP
jgi:2-dehydro-3-deoxygluconokinase